MFSSFFRWLFGKEELSDTLYVGNLVYTASKQDLMTHFSQFGQIVSARVIRDNRTKRSRGYGFVTFSNAKSAHSALKMEGVELKGRPMRVRFAHDKPSIIE